MKKKSKIPPLAAGQFWRTGNHAVVLVVPWTDGYFEIRHPITWDEVNNYWYANHNEEWLVHTAGNCKPGFEPASELVE